jgi:DNA (cytosine-5)-methyltransferase 1
MGKLRVLDCFAGIGGFSLGLERTGGFITTAFCEIEPFPQKVLAKHWPGVPIYDDIRTLTAERLAADGIAVDVITGGFPCQDISTAGKGAGLAGERSGLFYQITRLIGELEPRYVILENVAALLSRGLGDVLGTLAEIGYDAEWHCIPASYLGAWHRRDRVWLLAYPAKKFIKRRTIRPILRQHSLSAKLCGGFEKWPGRSALPPTRFCRAGNGVPNRVDRVGSLGNAVVPQIPELIGRAILASMQDD